MKFILSLKRIFSNQYLTTNCLPHINIGSCLFSARSHVRGKVFLFFLCMVVLGYFSCSLIFQLLFSDILVVLGYFSCCSRIY